VEGDQNLHRRPRLDRLVQDHLLIEADDAEVRLTVRRALGHDVEELTDLSLLFAHGAHTQRDRRYRRPPHRRQRVQRARARHLGPLLGRRRHISGREL